MTDFQRFWEKYPRRVGKKAAEKAFYRIDMTREILSEIFAALDRAQWPEFQYIPHPSTWLNGRRWTDEVGSGRPEKPPDRLIKPDGSVLVFENGGWHPEIRTGCCGMGTCTVPGCRLCTVIAKLPQPPTAMETAKKVSEKKAKRDGMFAVAAHDAKKLSKKRSRQGANWVPRHARIT